jgi:hypothetical protein
VAATPAEVETISVSSTNPILPDDADIAPGRRYRLRTQPPGDASA